MDRFRLSERVLMEVLVVASVVEAVSAVAVALAVEVV
jgi:hypothetical protein